MKKAILLGLIIFLVSGCIKDELPVPSVAQNDAIAGAACLSPSYNNQLFYDLGTNSIISMNDKLDWDMAVHFDLGNTYVNLNSARLMRAALTTETDLLSVADTVGLENEFQHDVCSGALDSLAVDLIGAITRVLVLDMGYNNLGTHLGFLKLKITAVSLNSFDVQYAPVAEMDPNQFQTLTINIDQTTYMTYASFTNGQQVYIEPPLKSYDLLFTQYTEYFHDANLRYLVVGALNARTSIRVAQLEDATFSEVTLDDTLMSPLRTELDVIGYDWKTFNFDNGTFVTDSRKVFIIQDAEGLYYKLRFIDFYDDQGLKGCPQFEVVAF